MRIRTDINICLISLIVHFTALLGVTFWKEQSALTLNLLFYLLPATTLNTFVLAIASIRSVLKILKRKTDNNPM